MPSQLPREIYTMIVEMRAEDRGDFDERLNALKALSLTSRSLHQLARKHVFSDVILKDPFDTNLQPAATASKLQRLLSASPEIAPYIKFLSYCIQPGDRHNVSLVATFEMITNLQILELWHSYNRSITYLWDHRLHVLKPGLLHLMRLPTLTTLRLSMIENFAISDLSSCNSIKHLELHRVDTDIAAMANPANPALSYVPLRIPKLHVHTLSLTTSWALCLAKCADGRPFIDFIGINDLVLQVYVAKDMITVILLLSCCVRLKTVHFEVLNPGRRWGRIPLWGLLHPSLGTLTEISFNFIINWVQFGNATADPFGGLFRELYMLRNRNKIETISIELCIGSGTNFSVGTEWNALDFALEDSGWPTLKLVRLDIVLPGPRRPALENMLHNACRTRFPNMMASQSVDMIYNIVTDE
ncbi:hypothetical protein BDN70DRAFT_994341 [Pholiota conissans]|uniref:Uncharacterized protein n=1 Tax=Pholiota conissans TaxID=109636 RepID=A0A9P5Z152_9AGAR|nr:hypothetical protein BDN70DRAFT_994341 [Pholiota conissans]